MTKDLDVEKRFIEKAAQLWCRPGLTDREMDPDLCMAIAQEMQSLKAETEAVVTKREREKNRRLLEALDKIETIGNDAEHMQGIATSALAAYESNDAGESQNG